MIAPEQVRSARALWRHRIAMVRLRTLLRNRIHAVLADYGYDRPAGAFSGPGRDWLEQLVLPVASRTVIEDCLTIADVIQSRIDVADERVHATAKADPAVKTLTTLPGIGHFAAVVILAEVGDFARFASAPGLLT